MDLISKIGHSIIHHGKENNRIYLMSFDRNDSSHIIEDMEQLAQNENYTKIIAKVPASAKGLFEQNKYKTEAIIPAFYEGKEDGYFLSKYFLVDREKDRFLDHCSNVLTLAKSKDIQKVIPDISKGFSFRVATEADLEELAALYQKVFATYPFPVQDKNYLLQTMHDNVTYFGIWDRTKLVAVSSIEAAEKYKNAEMTDFATLEEYRGSGLALYLLSQMELCMQDMGNLTAYTIARAKSYGMNITFSKLGYIYAGTLTNNTQIAGQIESMNVWYKSLIK